MFVVHIENEYKIILCQNIPLFCIIFLSKIFYFILLWGVLWTIPGISYELLLALHSIHILGMLREP